MWPFIIVGEFWFWSLFSVFMILELICAVRIKLFQAVLHAMAFFVVLLLFSDLKPFTYIAENWLTLIEYGALYIAIGVLWSFVHWTRKVYKAADRLSETIEAYRIAHNYPQGWAPETKDQWEEISRRISHYGSSDIESIIPKALNNKEEIVTWMTLWPFDMVIFLLKDLFVEMWDWLFSRFRMLYQSISNRAFRKFNMTSFPKE